MSNHSAEYPNGILDKETLKSFFAITEAADGTLTYTPGHERIPDNWYYPEPQQQTQSLTQPQVPPPPRRRQRIQHRGLCHRSRANGRRRPRSSLSGRQHGRSQHLHRRRPRQHHRRRLPDIRPHRPQKVRLLPLPAVLGNHARFPEE